ncbi:MAG: APC family permease [Chloroflexi bacterium]|nr:MAG: APC family permease [Chloroflexota bacterium]
MASTSAPMGGRAATGQGLFTRQSSGLVRELGIPAATGIALASVAVVNTFINFNAGLVSFDQAEMTLPLLLGAAIWLVAMFAYKYLLEAIPRAGGEYVYLSRIISPALGAMAGISICIAFTYILAANANFTATYTPFMLTALGAAFNSSAISDAAGNVTNQGAVATISVVMLLVVGAVSLVSIKRLAQVILVLVGIQLLAFLVLGWLLITHSHQDFVTALASFSNHPGAYNDILAAAQKDNIPLGFSIGASLTAVPFMVLNYNGVLYAYYVGGELKRPGRTYLYASVISIALLVVVWLGVWLLMRSTVGLDFMQSQAKLGATDPAAYGAITSLQSSAGGLGYGLILSGDPISKILIGIAVPSHRRGGHRHPVCDPGGVRQSLEHRRQPGAVRRPDHRRRGRGRDRVAIPPTRPHHATRRDGAAPHGWRPGGFVVGRRNHAPCGDRRRADHHAPVGVRQLHRHVGRRPGDRPWCGPGDLPRRAADATLAFVDRPASCDAGATARVSDRRRVHVFRASQDAGPPHLLRD